jgi:hypothetical protein
MWLGTKDKTKKYMEEGLEAWRANKGRPSHMEAPYNSSSSPTWGPGAVFGKTDAQATNGVWFQRSTYGWKDNFIDLPIQLVWGPNSFWVVGNRPNKVASRICPGAASPSFGLWAVYRRWAH